MPTLPQNFGLLPEEQSAYATAGAVILPVPFERTTSYGKGTASGPAAIIRASQSLELWDEELGSEPCTLGIATLPPFAPQAFAMEDALAEIEAEVGRHLAAGKLVVTLGGEHSLSLACARAARAARGELGVVQFDAHADLREEFEGTPYSHASVMRRVIGDGLPTLAVGVRSLSRPEAELIAGRGLAVVWGHELAGFGPERFADRLAALPPRIYLTFDIDYFDPGLVPGTGTPEPGGGSWYPTLALLRRLFAEKEVVAMDVVEVAPICGQPTSEFLAAKLVYKCLGYLQAARGR